MARKIILLHRQKLDCLGVRPFRLGEPRACSSLARKGKHDAPDAPFISEVAERQKEEGSDVPAQRVVVAGPRPREKLVEKLLHRSSFRIILRLARPQARLRYGSLRGARRRLRRY